MRGSLTRSLPIVAVLLAAACNSGSVHATATCGPPPPTAAPLNFLVYPQPGATNVPDDLGVLVVTNDGGLVSSTSLQISSKTANVPLGAATSVPSPLPTPNAIGTGAEYMTLVAVPLPKLSPATAYAVSYRYDIYPASEPQCARFASSPIGSFTTR